MVTDWKEVELLSLSNGGMQNGVFYEVSRKGSGIPLINVGDMYTNVPLTSEKLELFDATDDEIKRFEVNDGDLFFTRSSVVPSGIAFCNWYKKTSNTPVVFDSHVIRFKTNKNQVVPMFLYLQCISPKARRFFIANAKTATMTTIDQTIMGKCIIDLPPLPEQRRIAEVLSDTDALITAVERLIAKKRAIKQGAMQELLTGKRRLPRFEGEWIITTLGECCPNLCKGQLITESERVEGNIPVVAGGKNAAYYHSTYNRSANTITISASGANAGFVNFWTCRIFASDCSTIEESPDYSVRFVYYWLLDKQNAIYELQTGGAQPHVQPPDLAPLIMKVPEITEQTAIAEILSDMDTEIDKLTARLNKLRGIKQGMMSELLTGRIRLVEQNATVEVAEEIAPTAQAAPKGHNQQFDDAVMIAGIVNVLYSDKFPLGRKKVQKCLYLLRRHQDESTVAFKKKAAGPYADEVRYKGGEPIARSSKYITTTTAKKGTTFACGDKISQALSYIESWGRQSDIQWVADNLRFKKVDDLELLATVDMAICDLTEAGTPVTVQSIKHLIATNTEWKAKLKKQTFSDKNTARAIQELQTLLQGGETDGKN